MRLYHTVSLFSFHLVCHLVLVCRLGIIARPKAMKIQVREINTFWALHSYVCMLCVECVFGVILFFSPFALSLSSLSLNSEFFIYCRKLPLFKWPLCVSIIYYAANVFMWQFSGCCSIVCPRAPNNITSNVAKIVWCMLLYVFSISLYSPNSLLIRNLVFVLQQFRVCVCVSVTFCHLDRFLIVSPETAP